MKIKKKNFHNIWFDFYKKYIYHIYILNFLQKTLQSSATLSHGGFEEDELLVGIEVWLLLSAILGANFT